MSGSEDGQDDLPPAPPGSSETRRKIKRAGVSSSTGFAVMIPAMMAASVLVGCLLGYWADKWLGTGPWLLLLGIVLGMATAVRETLRLLRRFESESKDENK